MPMSDPTDSPGHAPRDEAAGVPTSEVECLQIARLLGEYLEGTLPRRTVELLEWHIDGCAPCVAFVNTYRGTIDAASLLRQVEIPSELRSRLRAVLRAQRGS